MQLNIARQQSSCSAAVWHGTEHLSDAYSTVSTHLCLHFILKNHAKSKLGSNIVANLCVIEAIINHNRSKIVPSKLFLTGVKTFHVYMYAPFVYTFFCARGVYVYLLCGQTSI